jgi:hypothetical protein
MNAETCGVNSTIEPVRVKTCGEYDSRAVVVDVTSTSFCLIGEDGQVSLSHEQPRLCRLYFAPVLDYTTER